jgi:hypothetical protein
VHGRTPLKRWVSLMEERRYGLEAGPKVCGPLAVKSSYRAPIDVVVVP